MADVRISVAPQVANANASASAYGYGGGPSLQSALYGYGYGHGYGAMPFPSDYLSGYGYGPQAMPQQSPMLRGRISQDRNLAMNTIAPGTVQHRYGSSGLNMASPWFFSSGIRGFDEEPSAPPPPPVPHENNRASNARPYGGYEGANNESWAARTTGTWSPQAISRDTQGGTWPFSVGAQETRGAFGHMPSGLQDRDFVDTTGLLSPTETKEMQQVWQRHGGRGNPEDEAAVQRNYNGAQLAPPPQQAPQQVPGYGPYYGAPYQGADGQMHTVGGMPQPGAVSRQDGGASHYQLAQDRWQGADSNDWNNMQQSYADWFNSQQQ